jgi:hypothetical protein
MPSTERHELFVSPDLTDGPAGLGLEAPLSQVEEPVARSLHSESIFPPAPGAN